MDERLQEGVRRQTIEWIQVSRTWGAPFVVIMRGTPGSEKTTFAQEVAATCVEQRAECAIVSADHYFWGPEGYAFDRAHLQDAHQAPIRF